MRAGAWGRPLVACAVALYQHLLLKVTAGVLSFIFSFSQRFLQAFFFIFALNENLNLLRQLRKPSLNHNFKLFIFDMD